MEPILELQCPKLTVSASDRWATLRCADDGRLILRCIGREQLNELADVLETRILHRGSSSFGRPPITITTRESSDIHFASRNAYRSMSSYAIADLARWLRYCTGTPSQLVAGDDSDDYVIGRGWGSNTELTFFDEWTFVLAQYQLPRLADALLAAAKSAYSGKPYLFVIEATSGGNLSLKTDDSNYRCWFTSDDDFELSLTPCSAAIMARRLFEFAG